MIRTLNKINFEYNRRLDILYINIKESELTYGDEQNYGILVNHDFNTNEIVGIDIWDFKLKMQRNESIHLPFDIDLKEVYNQLI